MILKLLAIIAALFVVYIIFFKKNRESSISKKDQKQDAEIEDILVECPTCKTFVSKNEGILSNGKYYCSKECLK